MSQNFKNDLGEVLGLILGQEKRLLNCTPDLGDEALRDFFGVEEGAVAGDELVAAQEAHLQQEAGNQLWGRRMDIN